MEKRRENGGKPHVVGGRSALVVGGVVVVGGGAAAVAVASRRHARHVSWSRGCGLSQRVVRASSASPEMRARPPRRIERETKKCRRPARRTARHNRDWRSGARSSLTVHGIRVLMHWWNKVDLFVRVIFDLVVCIYAIQFFVVIWIRIVLVCINFICGYTYGFARI